MVTLIMIIVESFFMLIHFRDLVAELPFILMHTKPQEETPPPSRPLTTLTSPISDDMNMEVDTNLIQLDT